MKKHTIINQSISYRVPRVVFAVGVAALLSSSVAGSANAAFVQFYTVLTQPTNDSSGIALDVRVLYAQFNGATDTVLTAFNFNRTDSNVTDMFYHKDDVNGEFLSKTIGTWSPADTGSAKLNRPFDSYLTIGGLPIATNGTLAISWGKPLSWTRHDVPNNQNVGWFNSAPGSGAGRVGQTGNLADSVRLGQFSIARDSYAGVWNLKIGYKSGVQGAAVQFAESTFSLGAPVSVPVSVPESGPGTFIPAALLLAGAFLRRRCS
jgi:hypothetical protein